MPRGKKAAAKESTNENVEIEEIIEARPAKRKREFLVKYLRKLKCSILYKFDTREPPLLSGFLKVR